MAKGLVVKCPVGSGHPKKAVMQQVNLSDIIAQGNLLKIVFVDAFGNPVTVDPSTVAGTLTCSDSTVTNTPTTDTLHYSVTVPAALASGGTVITESATATFNTPPASPALPGPFNGSLPILCNVSPTPSSPVDIQIQIGA